VKRLPHPDKKGYRHDIEGRQLSQETMEALKQCDTRNCRAIMPDGVVTICEYGLAFLGPYCGVEGRLIEKVGEQWVTKATYTAQEDEKRRKNTYCLVDS